MDRWRQWQAGCQRAPAAGSNADCVAHGALGAGAVSASEGPELSIVVIDGTWNNVKQMMKHFRREVGPDTPRVRLHPTTLSVYARTQTRSDGVSSVEAIALLLQELGEAEDVCAGLVRYIEVNNEALRLRPPPLDEEREDA
mmetsp:Transcript_118355/g.370113  ORF Transcript_118355/g.370113 Transcript_118355/m.370113 type:complete len:141 (-) Transcript_118355:102-524(-)